MDKRKIKLSVFFKILHANIYNSIVFYFGLLFTAFSLVFLFFTLIVIIITSIKHFNQNIYIPILIGLGTVLWGIFIAFIGGRKSLKTYNLYKTGIVKDAEIDTIAVFPNKGIRVTYHYDVSNEQIVYGNAFSKNYLLMDKESGDKIKIFVDRNNESNSVLVPHNITI